MGRTTLAWIGALACSVALILVGGIMVGGLAMHRYLQSTASQRGTLPTTSETSQAPATKRLVSVVSRLRGLPEVTGVDRTSDSDLYVTLANTTTPAQAAQVVETAGRDVADPTVSMELSVPATTGRAPIVVEFDNAFGTAVSAATARRLADALEAIATQPAVAGVRVTVPASWDYARSGLTVSLTSSAAQALSELDGAIAKTAFAGASWQAMSAGG